MSNQHSSADSIYKKINYEINKNQSLKRIDVEISEFDRTAIDSFLKNQTFIKTISGIIFVSEESDRKLVLNQNANLKIDKITNHEQKLELLLNSLEEAFKDRMSFLTDIEKNEFRDFLKTSSVHGFLFKINNDQKNLGLIFLENFERPSLGKVILENWIWSQPKLTNEEKKVFFEAIQSVLANYSGRIVAYVPKLNLPSINFHRRLGFKEFWFVIKSL